jgi:hypothetical protein
MASKITIINPSTTTSQEGGAVSGLAARGPRSGGCNFDFTFCILIQYLIGDNMEDYIDLVALTFHLETNALSYEHPFEIAQLFQIIRDKNIKIKMILPKKLSLKWKHLVSTCKMAKLSHFI